MAGRNRIHGSVSTGAFECEELISVMEQPTFYNPSVVELAAPNFHPSAVLRTANQQLVTLVGRSFTLL